MVVPALSVNSDGFWEKRHLARLAYNMVKPPTAQSLCGLWKICTSSQGPSLKQRAHDVAFCIGTCCHRALQSHQATSCHLTHPQP